MREIDLRWPLFILGVLVLFLREPRFFLVPRMWAEEASRFYAYAYRFSGGSKWYLSLLYVYRGYYSLWTNVTSTLAANLVTVESGALFVTVMAFLVQILPLAQIIWSRARFWDSPIKKVTGMLIFILTPLSGEIWLNNINSQFFLALTAILILIEPAENTWKRKWADRLLLLLAGLTGPVTSMLVPVYALVAWIERDRERLIQTILLAACATFQVGLMVISNATDRSIGARLMDERFYIVLFSMWTQGIGLMLAGLGLMGKAAIWLKTNFLVGNPWLVVIWIGLFILTVLIFWWLSIACAREGNTLRKLWIGFSDFIHWFTRREQDGPDRSRHGRALLLASQRGLWFPIICKYISTNQPPEHMVACHSFIDHPGAGSNGISFELADRPGLATMASRDCTMAGRPGTYH